MIPIGVDISVKSRSRSCPEILTIFTVVSSSSLPSSTVDFFSVCFVGVSKSCVLLVLSSCVFCVYLLLLPEEVPASLVPLEAGELCFCTVVSSMSSGSESEVH